MSGMALIAHPASPVCRSRQCHRCGQNIAVLIRHSVSRSAR